MARKINITCEGCHTTTEVTRTNEIPDNIISMGCNWCPSCEEDAEDYYDEWYNTGDGDTPQADEPINPRQKEIFPLYPDEKHYEKESIKLKSNQS